ncbi:hypothetical protein MXZ85_10075 [Acinetobacter baumannii]|uniref:hypothetical protein n=1 Tax=Acinetobacter baumannii TaxID=470 RepID=UPI0012314718|nr:hypothetical protein [Acinetobacter baumannii]EKU0206506.1 hypothetical protein [Acinetobacter baumannii]EKV6547410.1 hypothetical protein [Acinetobacter baumannii]ELB0409808.1 hypothetical protein [Acinetobacter baumannii]MBH8247409.1 hypothetical protein [Acinetobacter baumannii]MBS0694165.1 hypothetical protein [Acinetobacter baumannii]
MSEQDLEQQDELQDDENLDIETPDDDEDRDDPESNDEDTQEEGEEFDIVVGDEKPEEQEEDDFHGKPAPKWVKDLRKEKKESDRRIKELEAKLNEQNKPEAIELGEKPTLESVGYDADEFEKQLVEWTAKKAQFEQQEAAKRAEQEKAQKVWQDKLNSYETKKTAIKSKVRDFDEAEEFARDVLNQTQQGILIHAAEKPELLIYHLGKNPQKAKELAALTDPIQFAFAAAKIDAQIKVTTRKPSTSPERKPSGSAPLSGTVDTTLAKLRAEAERTGDYTEVNKYKRKLKQNQ